MLNGLSSNAILAKAKTMYGRRLDDRQYTELLRCKTVSDVAVYLKKETDYADALKGINERNVHRGELETVLRGKLMNDYSALARYEHSSGERFSDYLIRRGEIEQILHFLLLLNAGKAQEYILKLPVYFNLHTELDLFALAKARSFDDFLEALGNSPYRELLKRYVPSDGRSPDFALIENALYSYLYSSVLDFIDKHSRGKLRKELYELFGPQIDMINMLHIIRLKRYFNASPDMIRSMVMPHHYRIPAEALDRMIDAGSAEKAIEILRGTSYRRMLDKYGFEYPDFTYDRSMYDLAIRKMYFSIYPPVVMLSYIFIAEIELDNIIRLIEGIRYGLPKKEIAGMIIGYKNNSQGSD